MTEQLRGKIGKLVLSNASTWFEAMDVTAKILTLVKEALPELAKEAGYGLPIDDDGKALIEYHHAWAKANGYVKLAEVWEAIASEVEFPDDMPDELWERLENNRENVTLAMRNAVRLTKNNIVDKIKQAGGKSVSK